MITIRADSPLAAEVLPLLQRHVDLMWASSPPESVHVLDPAALAVPGVAFFTLREGEAVLGMGAVSRIDDAHAEIKSMHVVAEARGLYEKAGFTECPPFEGYTLDPNSVFMTRTLA